MIQDLALRWVVTLLFVLSAVECGYAIAAGKRTVTGMVGQGLHLVMAVAMAVMAWPRGAELPTIAPMVFFLLAAAWFLGVVLTQPDHRIVNGYHALMMLAMAWMYAVMNGRLLPADTPPAQQNGPTGGGHHHGSGGQQHGAHADMSPTNMAPTGTGDMGHSTHGGYPAWVDAINWFWTVGFALSALWWSYRGFTDLRTQPRAPAYERLSVIGQAMMAAGMAIMFAVML